MLKKLLPTIVTLCVVSIWLGFPGYAAGAVYYVSPTGSDLNPGAQSSPFLTIQHTANIVNPGDTVIVENGTYTNPGGSAPGCCAGANLIYLNRGGTAANWVTFQSANQWGAVIDGANNTTGDCWNFGPNANYIHILGFEVKGCSGTGFDNYGGGTNLDIAGNNIHDIGRYCATDGIGKDGIFLSHNNVTVEQNIIHDIGRYGPGENGCTPPNTYYESNDHGMYISGASNITVRNNIFYNNMHGWSLTIYSSGGASSNLSVVNNTFAFPNQWEWGHVFMGAPTTSSQFANNIFYQPNSYGVYFWNTSGYSNVSFSNNITYQGTIGATFNGAVTTSPSSVTGVTFTSNQDNTNPALLSPGTFDFYLSSASPAIRAGLQLSQVPNDFCGIARPQGPYDIGAFESSLGPCPSFPTFTTVLASTQQATVSVSSPDGNATPTGIVSLTVDSRTPITQALSSGSAVFSLTGIPIGVHVLTANYPVQNGFGASSESASVTITTVTLPSVSLSPQSLAFGNQLVQTTSNPQTVLLTNQQNVPLLISRMAVAGANAGDFSVQSTTCVAALLAGAQCSISISFTPSISGTAETASLLIYDSATDGTSPQSVALTGTGVAPSVNPKISLSLTGLNFLQQAVGTTSQQTITVTSTGTTPLLITSVTGIGPFAAATNCPQSLAPNASCTITVTFKPPVLGLQQGTVTIADNAPLSPQGIFCQGQGIASVSLSPQSLSFGNQLVQTASNPQTILLTNQQNVSLSISRLGIAGTNAADFSIQSQTCGTAVAAGSQCSISVLFTPSTTGTAETASLQITDNATDSTSPQSVALTGTGTAPTTNPKISLSPTSLSFLQQAVGTSSQQTITVTSTGTTPLLITSVTGSGAFAAASNCPQSLAPNASCTVTVTFKPAALGLQQGTVTIADNAPLSPQGIVCQGQGIASVSLSPQSLSFGNQLVQTTSNPQTVLLTNQQNAPLSISGLGIAGANAADFSIQSQTCGTVVAAGVQCAIAVIFTPSISGTPETASLQITNNATDGTSPQSVSLAGTGTAPTANPKISLSPTSLNFLQQAAGTTSQQTITVTSTGTTPLLITSVTGSGAFAAASNCPQSLAPNASCTITVTFKPTVLGLQQGTVTIADNAPLTPQGIVCQGQGIASASLSPQSLSFGNQLVQTASNPQTVLLTNQQNVSLSISRLGIAGANAADFSIQSQTCGAAVAPGSQCSISVLFTPSITGTAETASLQITSNATDGTSPQSVALTGTGTAPTANPQISLSPTSLNFLQQAVGSSSQQTITVTSTGATPLLIASITGSGAFAAASNCPQSLAPNASCTITVTFNPAALGLQQGTVTIADNAPLSPQGIVCQGQGIASVSLSPQSLSFGDQRVGATSSPLSVQLTNQQNVALSVSGLVFAGVNAGDFQVQSTTCGASLPPGAQCSVNVVFKPSIRGSESAALQVGDNASDSTSPQLVALTGTGVIGQRFGLEIQ